MSGSYTSRIDSAIARLTHAKAAASVCNKLEDEHGIDSEALHLARKRAT